MAVYEPSITQETWQIYLSKECKNRKTSREACWKAKAIAAIPKTKVEADEDNKSYIASLLANIAAARKAVKIAITVVEEKMVKKPFIERVNQLSFSERIELVARKMVEARRLRITLYSFDNKYDLEHL